MRLIGELKVPSIMFAIVFTLDIFTYNFLLPYLNIECLIWDSNHRSVPLLSMYHRLAKPSSSQQLGQEKFNSLLMIF
jgi:hypothetical protein